MTWHQCWCGRQAGHRYLTGWRCSDHTPAAIAGRPEPPTPDPACTIDGIRQALADEQAARAERQRLALLGIKTYRRPSGPGGRYTSADINHGLVRRAAQEVAELARQREGSR